MASVREAVRALAEGGVGVAPVQFTWAVYDGLRGATWLIVDADGAVREQHYTPGPPEALNRPLPLIDLGRVPAAQVRQLAATLLAQEFDRIAVPAAPVHPIAADHAVELTVVAGAEVVSVRCPAPLVSRAPALQAIGAVFAQLRAGARPA